MGAASSGVGRAWWLNLDADVELERPDGYQTKRALMQHAERQQPLLDALTLGEPQISRLINPRLIGQDEPAASAVDVVCWCPTPFALRQLAARGYHTPRAPALATLQRVNHRRFLFELVEPTSTRRWLDDPHDLAWLDEVPPSGVRLKRGFGFAGRGQRVIRPNPSPDDLRWLRDSLRDGLLLEPELRVRRELCIHGLLDETGVVMGRVCEQQCDTWGRVTAVSLARVDPSIDRELHECGSLVAARLRDADYFGPFGVDFLVAEGESSARAQLSEVNARMTLGWSVGMGSERETALRRLCAADNGRAQLL